jgi:hypothetical protein
MDDRIMASVRAAKEAIANHSEEMVY